MTEHNVLVLSAGRRVELIECFREAANELNVSSCIVAGDCSEIAPALYFADKSVVLPRISEDNYIDEIINVSNKENIRLIVPTIDTDLILLAENKNYIESNCNAKLLISKEEVIKICRDKTLTHEYLSNNGFGVPKLYESNSVISESDLPLFIKPKSGSSSINAFKVNTLNELELYQQLIPDAMLQDYIDGEEYTVDVFLDFDSNVISCVPRLRIATRSGEIAKGKIVKDKDIIKDVIKLMSTLKPIGHITVQLKKSSAGIKYIEINPRFGGGAPMSIKAGANSCKNLFKLLQGESLKYNEDYRDNLLFLRFDASICLNNDLETVNV